MSPVAAPLLLLTTMLGLPPADPPSPEGAVALLADRMVEIAEEEPIRVAVAVDAPMDAPEIGPGVRELVETSLARNAVDVDPRAARFKVAAECARLESGDWQLTLRLKDARNAQLAAFVVDVPPERFETAATR